MFSLGDGEIHSPRKTFTATKERLFSIGESNYTMASYAHAHAHTYTHHHVHCHIMFMHRCTTLLYFSTIWYLLLIPDLWSGVGQELPSAFISLK
jgi:hypothetical protein